MKKRPHINGEDVDNYFAQTETKQTIPPYDQKYARHTYRVSDNTHAILKAIAEDNGIPMNDLVRWVLRRFIKSYTAGEVELPIEQYVVTNSRLATE